MLTKHDCFCRCRICKPPLVGEYADRVLLWRFGAWSIVALVVAVAFAIGAQP